MRGEDLAELGIVEDDLEQHLTLALLLHHRQLVLQLLRDRLQADELQALVEAALDRVQGHWPVVVQGQLLELRQLAHRVGH